MTDINEATASVIIIAERLLSAEKDKTAALISARVDMAAGIVAVSTAEPIDKPAAVAELIRRYSQWIGKDTTLSDETGHKAWLSATKKKDWRYWARYRDLLGTKMSEIAVDGVDESTDRIIGLLEDPLRPDTWDRRGLVVGHVQSGKTANYTGLICKAADAGYKIIIILAGMHNNLRSQTQIRLEEGFLGYETSAAGDVVQYIGVGKNGRDSDIKPNCATNRTDRGDFNTRVARHLAITPEQRPWLFVVKKNKTVLERLLKWIQGHVADASDATGRKYVSNLPLLLIDDEADHASVDTGEQLIGSDGKPDEDHEPKAINSRIRKILHSFAKKAYVGYTATPFANIFIHRSNETPAEGPDLFPKSFIINLAAPSNYVGPTRVFGLRTAEGRSPSLPLARVFGDHTGEDGTGGWMPLKHPKDHVPRCEDPFGIPVSLQAAILSFMLACTVRQIRGQGRKHSSMLVHVTRFTQVQEEVFRQVDDFVRKVQSRLKREVDHESVTAALHTLWLDDFETTHAAIRPHLTDAEDLPDMPTWDEVRAQLVEVIADIDVRTINGKAKDALDYEEQADRGLKVIAIGGDKLARGLTLEGLCTSYFVRTTKMYDTLMQMGRWFGYRPGYLDLCRLYTTEELVEWFGHIADASEELRQEFDAMADSGATPRDYGLRVQSHPVLLVTSPLKMRSAKTLQLSFSGDSVETVSMHQDRKILQRNLETTNRLLASCGSEFVKDPVRDRNNSQDRWKGYVWNGVGSEHVAEFFEGYVTHPQARKVNSALLRDFIRSMAATGELTSWTIALLEGGTPSRYKFDCGVVIESMTKRTADPAIKDRYTIGRLLSPRDEAIDLDQAAWSAALTLTRDNWNPDAARQKDGVKPTPPEVPSGPFIRRVRGKGAEGIPAAPQRGLLLLYPLHPEESGIMELKDVKEPIIAFGVSFPSSNSAVKVEYAVDHLLWAQEYGAAD
jgi:hypothetical protein